MNIGGQLQNDLALGPAELQTSGYFYGIFGPVKKPTKKEVLGPADRNRGPD
jgi:hypothetical protein